MVAVQHFLAMGGYAPFVWPSFAIAALVSAGMWLVSGREARASERVLSELQRRRRGEDVGGDGGNRRAA